MRNIKRELLCASAFAAMIAQPAAAQTLADEDIQQEATEPLAAIEQIVVTARRTRENLQTTPVAVTALSAETLEKLNVQDINAVPEFTPNLTVSQQSGSLTTASIYIRGIGNQESSAVTEQGVGVYLDGVYIARSATAIFDLIDLERIEILRGPQGTLFGRNTVGGAIQLITKKPADDLEVEVKGGYARFDDWFARARIDTGSIAGLPIKAAFSYMHRQSNGYFDNTLVGDSRDPGALNSEAVTVALRAELGDLTADYFFDYNERRGTPPFFQTLVATPEVTSYFEQSASLGGSPFFVGTDRRTQGEQAFFKDRNGELNYGVKARIYGHALTLSYEPDPGLTLKSISSYREFDQDAITILFGNGPLRGVVLDPVTFEGSVQNVNLFGNDERQKQYQVSQEFQTLGTSGDLSYVAGAYYFYERGVESNYQALTFVLEGGQAGINLSPIQEYEGTTESYALFGQASYKPGGGDLELTAGLRYTWDSKTLELRGDVQPQLQGAAKFKNLSWLASANYRFTPDVMGYVRVSTGFRSGGINPRTAVINTFEPEKAVAYEIGLKSEFLNRRLRLNVAGFYSDYTDLQVQQFASGSGGATSNIVNAGDVNYKGVEVELTALPVNGFTISGSIGYTDPTYKTFLYRDPVTDQIINVADEARMPQTAKFNSHVGAEYEVDLGLGNFTARVDYAYRSTIYFFALDRVNPFNETIRSRPDHNVRARIGLSDIDVGGGRLAVSVWADNLTNDQNIDFGIDFGGLGFASGSFKKPRTVGVDARFSY